MFRSAAIAFYRSLTRHPLYAALNILGLSFGVAVFIVLSLLVRFEVGYERWVPGADDIYELRTRFKAESDMTVYGAAGVAKDEIQRLQPNLVGTRVAQDYVYVVQGNDVVEQKEQLVDQNFFRIFGGQLAVGDPATALRPDGVILSRAMANKYFGRSDVVGRRLVLREMGLGQGDDREYSTARQIYVVTGVLRPLPSNSTLSFDFMRLLKEDDKHTIASWTCWGAANHRAFFRLKPRSAKDLNQRMDAIVDHTGVFPFVDMMGKPRHSEVELRLVSLTGEHFADGRTLGRTSDSPVSGFWS
ncbi:MAG: ABC transporter permease [Asticcacaulis sp.]|nr:ABC transporter permease [Asticcacaulis sp.]